MNEPEPLDPSEALDEDELRVDPLEEGVEPPEHWSAAERQGTTRAEVREGAPMGERLAEEQPDVQPEPVPERPVAITPADQLDDSVDEAPADVDPVAPDENVPPRRADPDPGQSADGPGGSVADAIRSAAREA